MRIINKRLLINLFIVLAVVFTAACNDNKEKIEILKIDGIWKDSIPEDMKSKFPPSNCPKVRSYLLIPSSVQKDSDINIKLYGCWDAGNRIFGNQKFYTFKSTKKDNKITFTAYKKIFLDQPSDNDAMLDYFTFKSEYNITNDFEVRDVEFVVKNPDGEELTTSITIE